MASLLLLGGTQFVGRHLAEQALAAGHRVTLFHRGKTNPGLFPNAEHLHGDRALDLSALAGRTFDRVIDCCGYLPRVVRKSAAQLAGAAGHYTFISSVSVYRDIDAGGPPLTESSPVARIPDPTVEEITGDTYGALKALCEEAAVEAFGADRTWIVRPGLIAGPYDHTDRFTYWVLRAAGTEEFGVPGTPERRHPFIDVRDLAAWMLTLSFAGATGVHHAAGPNPDGRRGAGANDTGPAPTFGALLDTARSVLGGTARPVWIPADLVQNTPLPGRGYPLWFTGPGGREAHFDVDSSAAFARGLVVRPLADTIRDTAAWRRRDLDTRPLVAGPLPGEEAPLLARVRR
jgi:2'-hydroxyisoflavone reductase